MMNTKEMPAPCKDELLNNLQNKDSTFPPLPLLQVGDFQAIGAIAARLLVKELHRQLMKDHSNNTVTNPKGGTHV